MCAKLRTLPANIAAAVKILKKFLFIINSFCCFVFETLFPVLQRTWFCSIHLLLLYSLTLPLILSI